MNPPHELPRLSKLEFFRQRNSQLGCLLGEAIADHVSQFPDVELTPYHAAISAWAAVSTDVPNGGFAQFFYNHHGDQGVNELAILLDSFDLAKPASIIRDAAVVYAKHRSLFQVDNPWAGLFGSIEEFVKLETSLMRVLPSCRRAIEAWILQRIGELATDESGAPIDTGFTGTVESVDPSGWVKKTLEVKRGKAHGMFREFFDDGSIRDSAFYKAGKIFADVWPNGQLRLKESKHSKNRVIEWFYESGAVQKRYVKNKDGWAAEAIRLFHPNGQLAQELNTFEGKKRGPWLKFFEDGVPELQAEYSSDGKLIVFNAWNANRDQIVKEGSGVFPEDTASIDWPYDVFFELSWARVSELRRGIPHGKVMTYANDVLWSVGQYKNGQPDGEETLYWDNGKVRSITRFVKGTAGQVKEFPKFDCPVPKVLLTVEANEKIYTAWRHIRVDEYPIPLNLDEIQEQLTVPTFLHEVHARNLAGLLKAEYEDCSTFNDGIAYFLTVDVAGKVAEAKANGSGVYSVVAWSAYIPFLKRLRFTPGRIRGRPVECRVVARVDHLFVEGAI